MTNPYLWDTNDCKAIWLDRQCLLKTPARYKNGACVITNYFCSALILLFSNGMQWMHSTVYRTQMNCTSLLLAVPLC